jgi:hypothetical protein
MTDQLAEGVAPSVETLDDVFNAPQVQEREPVVTQPDPEPEPETEQPGDKEPEVEPPATEETETEDREKSVPMSALISERRKRQEIEAEYNELKKKADPSVDQDGKPDINTLLFNERTNMSREVMMDLKPDYEEMEAVFTEIAQNDQSLVMQMMRSPNPAKFAYNKAKEHAQYQQYLKDKESDEYKEFLKAKASGSLKKPVEETAEVKRKRSVLEVPNLNKVASLSSNSTTKERLETLDEMFGE